MNVKSLFCFISLLTLFSNGLYAQSRQTYNTPQSMYVRPDLDAFRNAVEATQKRHDNVRQYKDNVQDWIYKIRKADQQNHLKTKLDFFQNELDKLELRGDWTNLANEVRSIENGLKRMLSDYEEELKAKKQNEVTGNESLAEASRLHENGWKSYYQGYFEAAVTYFSQLTNLFPNDSQGYYGRGTSKSSLGKISEAIDDYNKAIALDPTVSMYFNNRGWANFTNNQLDFALIDLNEAVKLDRENYIAWDSRGEINFNLGNYSQSIEDCKMAIALNPNQANSYFIMGRANYRLGNKSLACQNWQKAKALEFMEAANYLGKYCK